MGLGPRNLMLIGAGLILTAAVSTVLDRRRSQKASPYSVRNSGDTKPV
jgi:hypothetical protein